MNEPQVKAVASDALFDPSSDEMTGVGSRGEMERAQERAFAQNCDGSCSERGGHAGNTICVRVRDETGYDWGYFSYCETAIEEDTRRGFRISRSNPSRHAPPLGGGSVDGVVQCSNSKDSK